EHPRLQSAQIRGPFLPLSGGMRFGCFCFACAGTTLQNENHRPAVPERPGASPLQKESTMRFTRTVLLTAFVLSAFAPCLARGGPTAEFQPDPRSVRRSGPGYRYPQAGWIVLHIE